MVFGELGPEQEVLHGGEGAVGDVFPERHAAAQGLAAEDAAADHAGVNVAGDERDEGGEQGRGVLIIRMHHDDHVGAGGEGGGVAGLLVAAVAEVALVHDDVGVLEGAGEGDGLVAAGVVHHDDAVHHAGGHDLVVGAAKGARGVVGGHDDDDAAVVVHGLKGGMRDES